MQSSILIISIFCLVCSLFLLFWVAFCPLFAGRLVLRFAILLGLFALSFLSLFIVRTVDDFLFNPFKEVIL